MPIANRAWYAGEHPPACTCVDCVRAKAARLDRRDRRARTLTIFWFTLGGLAAAGVAYCLVMTFLTR